MSEYWQIFLCPYPFQWEDDRGGLHHAQVFPSPLRLSPPTLPCQDEKLLSNQLCQLSNKRKKPTKMGKKAVKGKYSIAMLSLVFIGKNAKYSTDTVVFLEIKPSRSVLLSQKELRDSQLP